MKSFSSFRQLTRVLSMLGIFGASAIASATPRPNSLLPKKEPVVGQFCGIFDDEWEIEWEDRTNATTPFDAVDYLYIAFAHSYKDAAGKYILSYENARHGELEEGDADEDRIDYVVSMARAKNPNVKIIISLGWGLGDISSIAGDPAYYAASVVEFIRTHKLDGFDLDFEPPQLPLEAPFTNIATLLRNALDDASQEDGRNTNPYLFTITPSTTSSYKNWKDLSALFDFVNLQTFWGNTLLNTFLNAGVPKEKITLGLLSEGYEGTHELDEIDEKIVLYDQYDLAGIFGWRLDTDTIDETVKAPTYEYAKAMWEKIHADRPYPPRSRFCDSQIPETGTGKFDR